MQTITEPYVNFDSINLCAHTFKIFQYHQRAEKNMKLYFNVQQIF